MGRRPRLAAQAARASLQTPIQKLSDNEDEDMTDVPPATASTPQEEEDEDGNDDGEDDDEQNDAEEEEATPSRPERPSGSATLRRRGRPVTGLRRRGRPPKNLSRVEVSDDGNDAGSDAPTPRRRGGFRGHRGGRWARARSGVVRSAPAPLDEEGNALSIVGDEVDLPEDPEGEKKINKNGELQGGREYRVRTFTILGRDERLYMLSTEPARCIGFRDSYLFFQKHKHLYKIIIDDEEKRDLIDRDLIPHSYKGRAIGVVTARSVFREFGARIIIGGKKVTDDYDVKGARERGDLQGETAVPEDRLPLPGEPYNRNQYVAWHGASAVYHTNLPSVPIQVGKLPEPKRKKVTVTRENWMLEHARDASRFNSLMALSRLDTNKGVYDIHSNTMQWPAATQPTHARWEECTSQDHALVNGVNSATGKLPLLDPVYARAYCIQDLCLESKPETSFPSPGEGMATSGLLAVPAKVRDALPVDCGRAFDQAARREADWRSRWLGESVDGHRARFLPSVEWFPK